jgi:glycosyltransferase involved in cell wall biosynthesis
MTAGQCREYEDLPQDALHRELPQRRVYVHPFRWTSLGLSLIEAMYLGMPVVVLAATEAPRAVPPAAGAISTDVAELHAAVSRFIRDPEAARAAGLAAREAAGARYGLKRFLREWDQLLQEVRA